MRIALVIAALLAGCGLGGPVCTDTKHGDLCLPEKAKPDVALTFKAGNDCANTCGTSTSSCDVTKDGGGRFLVSIGEHACQESGDVACPDICRIVSVDCVFPALPAGEYEVIVNNGGTRKLTVAEGGADTCAFAHP